MVPRKPRITRRYRQRESSSLPACIESMEVRELLSAAAAPALAKFSAEPTVVIAGGALPGGGGVIADTGPAVSPILPSEMQGGLRRQPDFVRLGRGNRGRPDDRHHRRL